MSTEVLKELEAKVQGILPSEERRQKGPYALFECFQNIPCNPCYTACKFNAVRLWRLHARLSGLSLLCH